MKRSTLLFVSVMLLLHGTYAQNETADTASFGRRGRFCSCAAPSPVPLTNGVTQLAAVDGDRSRGSACLSLPLVGTGRECGAALGICRPGLCCSQKGFCSRDATACDGTCQCQYSGIGSKCRGAYPMPTPISLPTAPPGGPCGKYVANCPASQCCSQFGICVDDGSVFCSKPSCRADCSPKSRTCGVSSYRAAGFRKRVVRQTWTVNWKNMTLDGFPRPVIVFNDQLFPTLNAQVGDRVIVKLINGLNEPASIHWHGMLQLQTNIMDGVTGVTQRPVMPGESYIYNFIADTAGTFWFHSHFRAQYVDGLRGQLIVTDPTDKSYPAEGIVAVNEWYHEVSSVLLQQYMSPASGGADPQIYTALMNGVGQGYCVVTNTTGCTYAYVKGEASFCDNPKTRLRLINAGGYGVFNISIDNHRMIVVAEDAVQVNPVEVGSLQINNGQRYDVLVCQTPGTQLNKDPVWIRAVMFDDLMFEPSVYNTSLGVLYYTDSKPQQLPTSVAKYNPPILTPTAGPAPGQVINPYFLTPFGYVVPPPATKSMKFDIEFYSEPQGTNGTVHAHMNKIALSLEPESPSLLERLSNNPMNIPPPQNPTTPPGGVGWHTIDVKTGDVIDLIINNNGGGQHPLHLHGHWFWVMAAGLPNSGPYLLGSSLTPHIIRDTVTVNFNSFVVLRFVANNPGTWIMHCHIDWHLAAGLGMIFKEGL